ncbi:hypothetical protein CSPAE12_00229, partial [Colletotrichum incanum]
YAPLLSSLFLWRPLWPQTILATVVATQHPLRPKISPGLWIPRTVVSPTWVLLEAPSTPTKQVGAHLAATERWLVSNTQLRLEQTSELERNLQRVIPNVMMSVTCSPSSKLVHSELGWSQETSSTASE